MNYLSVYMKDFNNQERKLDNEANHHTCVKTRNQKPKINTLPAIQSKLEANAKQNAYLFPNP